LWVENCELRIVVGPEVHGIDITSNLGSHFMSSILLLSREYSSSTWKL
jgi:hypothetical protein